MTKVNNKLLQELRKRAIPQGVSTIIPHFIDRGKNAELWDVENQRYIDFSSGIAVVNTGHSNSKINDAVNRQNERFSHVAFQVVAYENYLTLADRLNRLSPIKKAKTIFFTTGAEAVENAIKIARYHTHRSAVISFAGGFHGRSLLTLGLTGKIIPYKSGFGPFPAEIYHVPFPVSHYGITEKDCLEALHRVFKCDVEPSRVAAIIIEPIQGEGGFYIAPKSFLQELRRICDEHGILLICDEVQSGFARTGKLFCVEHYDLEPDMITIAKALAGGYPLSGVIGKDQIMDSVEPGGLGGTFGGSPIGCAAAHEVLNIIEEEQLCNRSMVIGKKIIDRIQTIKEKYASKIIGDIRGLGAMVAFELVNGQEPDSNLAKQFVQIAFSHGLIILPCGIFGNTIRVLPPLTIEDNILDEGLDCMEKTIKQLSE